MADHCWHHCGFTYTSDPPQYDEKCCRCGKVRRVRGERFTPKGHGPFVQVWCVRDVPGDAGPCEGAQP
jgi:hypothetical protein